MGFVDILNIKYYLFFTLMIMGGMSSKALAITIIAGLALLNANTMEQYEIIFIGYVCGYLLSNFRE